LSYGFWQTELGGDRNILGSSITLNGVPRTVLGVMPAQFHLLDDVKAWVPASFTPAQLSDTNRGNENLTVIARMGDGVTLAQAEADVKAIAASVLTRVPARRDFLTRAHWSASVVPMREQVVGDIRPAVLTLYAAVVLLLLMACANVANLLLARATADEGRSARASPWGHHLRGWRGSCSRRAWFGGHRRSRRAGASCRGVRTHRGCACHRIPRLDELSIHWGTFAYAAIVVLATAIASRAGAPTTDASPESRPGVPGSQCAHGSTSETLDQQHARDGPACHGPDRPDGRRAPAAHLSQHHAHQPGFAVAHRVDLSRFMPRVRYPMDASD
jgi:hypothetical protein